MTANPPPAARPVRPPSTHPALWIALPVVTLVALCTALGAALTEDEPDPRPVAAAPAAAAPTTAGPVPSPAPSTASSAAVSLSAAEDPAAFVAALRTIGPDLIRGNQTRAVDGGRRLCGDIRDGLPAAQQGRRAAARYSGGGVVVNEQQGAKIVAAAVRHLCPDLAALAAPGATPSGAGRTTTRPATPTRQPTTGPADVYYRSCDEVRAAGRAPLLRGQPGYRSGLDGDGDGVACDT